MQRMRTLLSLFLLFHGLAATDLLAIPPKIEGAKVESEGEARHLAFKQYVERMKGDLLAEEGVRKAAIIKLGYDLPGFANKGDLIWETRVLTIEDELRGIIWIHPNTEKAHFIAGAWDQTNQKLRLR